MICGMVYDVILWCDTIRYDMIWTDMIWCNEWEAIWFKTFESHRQQQAANVARDRDVNPNQPIPGPVHLQHADGSI